MCTGPREKHDIPRPSGGGEDPGHGHLHIGKRPKELSLDELSERVAVMMRLRPLLLAASGHDHCPLCLGCRPDDEQPEALKPAECLKRLAMAMRLRRLLRLILGRDICPYCLDRPDSGPKGDAPEQQS